MNNILSQINDSLHLSDELFDYKCKYFFHTSHILLILTDILYEDLWFSFPCHSYQVDRDTRADNDETHACVIGGSVEGHNQQEDTAYQEGDRDTNVELKIP